MLLVKFSILKVDLRENAYIKLLTVSFVVNQYE